MIRFVDGDIFGAVTRLGRDAAEGVALAVGGAVWDPFLAARCLDVLVSEANGIPSLPGIMRELRGLQDAPLLANTLVEISLDRIGEAVRDANGTILDLMLRSAAERCVLRGQYEAREVLETFCTELLDRAIISGQGGFLELDGGPGRRDDALSLLRRVAAEGAAVLEARPDAQRLGLARLHANLEADTNLLGDAQ